MATEAYEQVTSGPYTRVYPSFPCPHSVYVQHFETLKLDENACRQVGQLIIVQIPATVADSGEGDRSKRRQVWAAAKSKRHSPTRYRILTELPM